MWICHKKFLTSLFIYFLLNRRIVTPGQNHPACWKKSYFLEMESFFVVFFAWQFIEIPPKDNRHTIMSKSTGIFQDGRHHWQPSDQQELSYRKQIARQLHKH